MPNPGWQQPPLPAPPPRCTHTSMFVAALSLHRHAEGHEWVCVCGQVFVVVSDGGRDKHLVKAHRVAVPVIRTVGGGS